ncbi:MAG TPA: GntR family transcriptional regulator, partial [Pseudonocardiaceae bacterium]|nr:GntR family transcriptional regulator [Pseudonocardiaceae bacterium]
MAVQLADALRSAAGAGALRAGDRLPSTRALAATLGVSRTVTAAAYDALTAEGWIQGRHGAGTYLLAAPGTPIPPPCPGPADSTSASPGADEGIDLLPGRPWAAGLRPAIWRRAWRAAADGAVLSQPVDAGLPEFRAAIVEHLLRHRGLAIAPEGVLATSGTTAVVAELAA